MGYDPSNERLWPRFRPAPKALVATLIALIDKHDLSIRHIAAETGICKDRICHLTRNRQISCYLAGRLVTYLASVEIAGTDKEWTRLNRKLWEANGRGKSCN